MPESLNNADDAENISPLVEKAVVWKLQNANPRFASVRYRCLMPAIGLSHVSVRSLVISGADEISAFDKIHAIIFVKSFTDHDLALARRAHASHVLIYIDLCDNIFTEEYGGAQGERIRENFTSMCNLAAGIVTTGPELARVLREHIPASLLMHIVPDQLEEVKTTKLLLEGGWLSDHLGVVKRRVSSPQSFARLIGMKLLNTDTYSRAIRNPKQTLWRLMDLVQRSVARRITAMSEITLGTLSRRLYWCLPHSLRDTAGGRILRDPHVLTVGIRNRLRLAPRDRFAAERKFVVWFGHHGSSHGRYGMLALHDIVGHMIRVNRQIPLRLIVISDNPVKFRRLFWKLPFPAEYRQWNPLQVFNDIKEGDVCVVPNTRDKFSITKSANRVVMALSLGVPVVATRVPATEPLEQCVIHDTWEDGIRAYLLDRDLAATHIARAQTIIAEKYSMTSVAGSWICILTGKARGWKPPEPSE